MTTTTLERPTTKTPELAGSFSVQVAQGPLKEALAIATRFVNGKSFMPILTNVLLEAEGESLTLACTDLECGVRLSLPATVREPGTYTVPAKLLDSYTATLADEQVSLVRERHTLRVQCGRAKASLKGTEPDDFPPVPQPSGTPVIVLPARTFVQAIRLTMHAAADESSLRDVLKNINLHIEGTTLTAQTADGHRVAKYTTNLADTDATLVDASVLVPAKAAALLERLLGSEPEGDISVWLQPKPTDARQMLVQWSHDAGTLTMAIRLSEGIFPDLERAIPRTFETDIRVNRAHLLAAIQQALLFAAPSKDFRALRIDVEIGAVMVRAHDAEQGEGISEVAAGVEGAKLVFGINGPYLRDVLTALPGEQVRLQVVDALSPILITDPHLDGYRAVICSMQLTDKGGA